MMKNILIIAAASTVILFAGRYALPLTNGEITSSQTGSLTVKNFSGIEMVLIVKEGRHQFWMARHEVTQRIYSSIMKSNPSYFRGDDLPVEQVSWFNAVEFCNRLSEKSGLAPYYTISRGKPGRKGANNSASATVTINPGSNGFRLPVSTEWEYAASAGSATFSIDRDCCWYRNNSRGSTHAVGTKMHNAFGLFDICGNVREWCFDWHPSFPDIYRIVKDGHYDMSGDEFHPSVTDYRDPALEFGFIGIRLAKNL